MPGTFRFVLPIALQSAFAENRRRSRGIEAKTARREDEVYETWLNLRFLIDFFVVCEDGWGGGWFFFALFGWFLTVVCEEGSGGE